MAEQGRRDQRVVDVAGVEAARAALRRRACLAAPAWPRDAAIQNLRPDIKVALAAGAHQETVVALVGIAVEGVSWEEIQGVFATEKGEGGEVEAFGEEA